MKNSYDKLTKNLFKHLSKGEEVVFGNFTLLKEGEKLRLKGRTEKGEEVELFFNLEKGRSFGLSKDQLKRIVAFKEKPAFSARTRK